MTLEDRNVTYLAIDGWDPVTDAQFPKPEHILLRIFVAASWDPRQEQDSVLVHGSVTRESLERELRWGVDGGKLHHFTCLSHVWKPSFRLR